MPYITMYSKAVQNCLIISEQCVVTHNFLFWIPKDSGLGGSPLEPAAIRL